MSGNGQGPSFKKKVMISTSGPAAEIPDGSDGCAVKSQYERNGGFLKTVAPEARNERTSSNTQVLGPVQDSEFTVGTRLIGASPVWGPMLGLSVSSKLVEEMSSIVALAVCLTAASTRSELLCRIGCTVASAAPIAAAGHPNRGGSY